MKLNEQVNDDFLFAHKISRKTIMFEGCCIPLIQDGVPKPRLFLSWRQQWSCTKIVVDQWWQAAGAPNIVMTNRGC